MKKTSPEPREEDKIPPPVPAEPGDSSAGAEATEEDLVASLQSDLDRFRDLALRTQADFENYKKRAARERDEGIKYANRTLLERLVPIVDNFELGLSAAREESKHSPIYSGMKMVLKQLTDFLTENGLEPIDAVGKQFDPNLQEAIGHEPNDEVPEGRVIRQTRRGYRLKDRLLRPAAVVVSSGAGRSRDE
ncbi:MAG: nucleotide exchange factor GrpE [Verrucomicrobia bacterium]|nr:MAG: nucleotide exchange factor GrpE [Verrucomicrobiota bacterium]